MEKDAVRVIDVVCPWLNLVRRDDGRIELRIPGNVEGNIAAPGVIIEFADFDHAQAFSRSVMTSLHEAWWERHRTERIARIEDYANKAGCLHLRRTFRDGRMALPRRWVCLDCGHEGGAK